jgi:hypothetical protein
MRRFVLILPLFAGAMVLTPIVSTSPAAAVAAVHPDFNGDGFADLAVGAQFENDGRGMVHVLYGSATGPEGRGSIAFDQDTPNVPGLARSGDVFGSMLAHGDVNADGYDDLAVSAHNDRLGDIPRAGSVTVFTGSAAGLRMRGQMLTDNFGRNPDAAHRDDQFGLALAMGDYDGDGFDDQFVSTDLSGLGTVKVFRSQSGTFNKNSVWRLDRGAIPARYRFGGLVLGFGYALATLHGSAPRDGLAVGIPGYSQARSFASGAVAVFQGGSNALPFADFFYGRLGAEGQFGATLAAGDLTNDGEDDLAIGAPFAENGKGVVVAMPLAPNRRRVRAVIWDLSEEAFAAPRASGDFFGYSMAIVDAGTDAYLYIGAPGNSVRRLEDAGHVYVFVSHPLSCSLRCSPPVPFVSGPIRADNPQGDARFGLQITALDATNDGFADVVISANGDTVDGRVHAGSVWFYDSDNGAPVVRGGRRISQNTPGVPGIAETNDMFGSTLSFL